MPVRPPLFVTLTGAYDATDIARMADLSAHYPVEWAAIAASVPEGQPYWIDRESGVRTEDRFDLDKCELVLMQVYEAG